jgi:hypothetical protein
MGHGDGTFASAVVYDLTGLSVGGLGPVAIADVNGDGKADLVVAGDCIAGQCPHGAVGVLLGNGDGTFRPVVISDAGAGFGAEGVAVVDLNGDGKLDVVVGECGTTDCFASEGLVGVLLGNGDGTFQPASTYDSGGALADSVAVADLNGDGKLDVVVGNVVGESVGVLLGNGDGTLRAAQTYRSGGNLTYTVVLGDLNGDGRPDLMVSSCAVGSSCGGTIKGAVGIWLGVGDGTFESGTTRRDSGTETLSIATADLDRDGILDLAATNSYATETLDTFLGNGDGTLRRGVILECNGECVAVAAADVNGDGQPDLLVADSQPCYACDNSGSVGVILKKPGDSSLDTRDIHKQK